MSLRVQFACSVWPSVWGWKAVNMANLVPRVLNKDFQNLLVNLGSWSVMMDFGRPWSWKMLLKNSVVVSGAVALVVVGMKCTIFKKVSTMMMIALNLVLV